VKAELPTVLEVLAESRSTILPEPGACTVPGLKLAVTLAGRLLSCAASDALNPAIAAVLIGIATVRPRTRLIPEGIAAVNPGTFTTRVELLVTLPPVAVMVSV